MSLIQINWKPTDKMVRDFGLVTPLALTVLSIIGYFTHRFSPSTCLYIVLAGLAVTALSLISVTLTRYIYLTLIIITFPIGLVVSYTLMAIFYFGIITPLGLFFRLIRRDPLNRTIDPNAPSYWIQNNQTQDIKRYFKQF